MKKRLFIIPIFIPDLGCPNQCVFCNQKKITGKSSIPTPEQVRYTIEEYLETIPEDAHTKTEIAFYGGSFTAIPKKEQIAFLEVAHSYARRGLLSGIRLSTRPDRIDEDILSTLKAYGVTTIELGVQSMEPEVLKLSQRGHSVADVEKASKLIRSWGFFLGIQLIIGLPGDSQEKAIETCEKIIKLQPDFVRIYPLLVLRDTELQNMLNQGKYRPWTVDEVVLTAKVMLNRFNKAKIEVIRIGLQNTEEISSGGDIVAGPYHPAIGEMVYSSLYLDILLALLAKAGVRPGEIQEIELCISPKDESKVRGHKSDNLKKLRQQFGFENIIIKTDKEIKPGTLILSKIDKECVALAMEQNSLTL